MLEDIEPITTLRALSPKVRGAVLIDASWMVHRSYHAYKDVTSLGPDGERLPTGMLFGFIRSIISISKRVPQCTIVLCLDDIKPDRAESDDTYKAGRPDTSHVWEYFNDVLRVAMAMPHVTLSFLEGMEADDHIYSLSQRFAKAPVMENIYIHVTDNDLWQSLTQPKIHAFHKLTTKHFELIGRAQVIEKYHVEPTQLAMYRALTGDKSDNLPGYPRINRECAQLFATYTDPLALLNESEDKFEGKYLTWFKRVKENRQIVIHNYDMMKLSILPDPNLFIAEGSLEPLHRFGMNRLLENIQEIMQLSTTTEPVTERAFGEG